MTTKIQTALLVIAVVSMLALLGLYVKIDAEAKGCCGSANTRCAVQKQ